MPATIASGLALALLSGSPAAFAHADVHAGVALRAGPEIVFDGAPIPREDRDAKRDAAPSALAAGVVTSVSDGSFTLAPFGTRATTTIETGAHTAFLAHGAATTSAALAVGAHVLVSGTTTATSTGETFLASVVRILGTDFGRLRIWLTF